MTTDDPAAAESATEHHEYTTSIDVRFGDLDVLGHVNNAVYASYLELARARYFRDVHGLTLSDTGIVLANLEIDFRRPIDELTDVAVGVSVTAVGESSFTMEYTVATDGTVSAEGRTVQVVLDDDGEPTAVPAAWRERFTRATGESSPER